jgi:hypothetical protein
VILHQLVIQVIVEGAVVQVEITQLLDTAAEVLAKTLEAEVLVLEAPELELLQVEDQDNKVLLVVQVYKTQ